MHVHTVLSWPDFIMFRLAYNSSFYDIAFLGLSVHIVRNTRCGSVAIMMAVASVATGPETLETSITWSQ